jgi:tyrosyl-tRNA synthetase
MYGKLMSISDVLMWRYYEFLTDMSLAEIDALRHQCATGEAHPMKVKQDLAKRIVADFHSAEAADQAAENWTKQFQKDETPEDLETVEIQFADIAGTSTDGTTVKLEKLLHRSGLAESVSDGVRKIKQKAVRIGNEVKADSALLVEKFPVNITVRVGRKIKRVLIHK